MLTSSAMSDDCLLELEAVTVTRQLEMYRAGSFRDVFVDALSARKRKSTRVRILDQLNLKLRRGERVGIIGPNGAGKSTLCRCAAGLLPVDSGQVHRNGTLRAIFETQLAVQPELTGRENGYFLADFLYPHLSRVEKQSLIEEALDFSGLGDFLDTPFRNYSFGMQTRLGLSILSSAPSDILILDEVFQGADKGFSTKITERFYSLMRKSGAVIFVSHSMEEIRMVCNRVVVLDQGKIIADGSVESGLALYESRCRPVTLGTQHLEL